MRALAYTDIDAALREGFKRVIAFNERPGRFVHPDSRDALASIKKNKKGPIN
jgi:hypothetical protein